MKKSALSILEKQLGEDHPDVAKAYNNIGLVLQTMGRMKEAKPYFTKAVDSYEASLGSSHPNLATSLNNLAGYAPRQRTLPRRLGPKPSSSFRIVVLGDCAAIHPLCHRGLATPSICHRSHPEPMWPRLLTAALNSRVCRLHRAQGDRTESVRLYERSLAIRQKVRQTILLLKACVKACPPHRWDRCCVCGEWRLVQVPGVSA